LAEKKRTLASKALLKMLDGAGLGFPVEVNQYVAAEDGVDAAH